MADSVPRTLPFGERLGARMPVLLHLAYDGRDLQGCPELPEARTVLGELRGALARVGCGGDLEVLSRTDAGVHARGQVAVLEPDVARPDGWWLGALDRQLPDDLRCLGVAVVTERPRVLHKTYAYTVDLSPAGDPFLAHRAWRLRVDPERVRALLPRLEGTHDFEAFRRRHETRDSLVRTILGATAEVEEHRLTLRLCGEGFFYRAVRSLVGAVLAVARDTCTEAELDAALAGQSSPAAQQQAPARGLCLESMTFEPEPPWRLPR